MDKAKIEFRLAFITVVCSSSWYIISTPETYLLHPLGHAVPVRNTITTHEVYYHWE